MNQNINQNSNDKYNSQGIMQHWQIKPNQGEIVSRMELARLIRVSLSCGIKKDAIGFAVNKFKDMVDDDFHEGDVASISEKLYNAKKYWVRKGLTILIDGGQPRTRELFGCACLFRFLANNFYGIGSPINVRMGEVIAKLSTFDKSRFILAEQMKHAPCLFVQEIDTREHPRDTNDCIMLLDAVFHHRIMYGKPMLFTINPNREFFTTPGVFGKVFADVITRNNNVDVLHVRIK